MNKLLLLALLSGSANACDLSWSSTCIQDATQDPSLGVISGAVSMLPVVGEPISSEIDGVVKDKDSTMYKVAKGTGQVAAVLGGGEVFGAFKAKKALDETKAAIEAARAETAAARAETAKARLETEALRSAQVVNNKRIEELHDVLVALPRAKAEHINTKGE